jgi:ribonuclease BN (tRNA processing enzyme)
MGTADTKPKKNSDFSVIILGSGTCVPSLKRSACSVLMAFGDQRLLFDLGAGTMCRLLEADVSIFEIGAVFFSHFHPDHTGELASFMFANKYPDGNRRKGPLTLIGGNGFKKFFSGLQKAYGRWIELKPEMLKLVELGTKGNERVALDSVTVRVAPMAHNVESLAYRVTTTDGRAVVYSGDTDFNEDLISLSEGADVLICESATPDELKVKGHLTPSLAGTIATRAGVGRLVLTHLYPECDGVDIIAQCRKTYAGLLTTATDLMKIDI